MSDLSVGTHWVDCWKDRAHHGCALARIRELEADNANWKRLYERRGLALARPCIACGHVPAVIKPTSQPVRAAGGTQRVSMSIAMGAHTDDTLEFHQDPASDEMVYRVYRASKS